MNIVAWLVVTFIVWAGITYVALWRIGVVEREAREQHVLERLVAPHRGSRISTRTCGAPTAQAAALAIYSSGAIAAWREYAAICGCAASPSRWRPRLFERASSAALASFAVVALLLANLLRRRRYPSLLPPALGVSASLLSVRRPPL